MNDLASSAAFVTQPIGWALLHSLWQIGVLALALKVALCLVSQQNARLRYALACVALLLSLIGPVATLVLVPRADAATASAPRVQPVVALAKPVPSEPAAIVPVASSDALVSSQRTCVALADRVEPLLPSIVVIWLLGVLLFALRAFLGWLTLRKWSRANAAALPSHLQVLVQDLTARIGIRRAVRVVRSTLAQAPIVIGFVRPIILLPAVVVSGLSTSELETILLHELAHIRRCDPLVNLLQTVLEALLFHHPGMWWISRVVRDERERCCDDIAVAYAGDRVAYIRALAMLESARSEHPVAAVAATGGSLLARVRRLVHRPQRGDDVRPASLLVILATVAALALGFVSKRTFASTAQGGVSEQRRANEAAFARERVRLRSELAGRWVAIAGGAVHGPFASWQQAVDASDAAVHGIAHRFVFRPGVDDGDVEFVTSPWVGTPNWNQLGQQFQFDQKLTIAAWLVARDGRSVPTPDGHLPFRVGAPGAPAELSAAAVCSGLFEHELTLTAEQARKLALDRFAVPGVARDRGFNVACTKARCRVVIEELGIDTVLTAFVVPAEVVKEDRATEAPVAFVVTGKVTDATGSPMSGVTIQSFTGVHPRVSNATVSTTASGEYRLIVSPREVSESKDPRADVLFIVARKPGFAERDLHVRGDRLTVQRAGVPAFPRLIRVGSELIGYTPLAGADEVSIDFVMVPAARIQGVLRYASGRPIVRGRVSFGSAQLMSYSLDDLDAQETDDAGRFTLASVPANQVLSLQIAGVDDALAISSEFTLTAPALYGIVVTLRTDDPPSATIEWRDRPDRESQEVLHRGGLHHGVKAPEPDVRNLTWGSATNGLQAAIELPAGPAAYSIGDAIAVAIVVRNVSDHTITFASSSWREDDELEVLDAAGKRVSVSRNWFSGLPVMQQWELAAGEEARLMTGSIGLARADGEGMMYKHPVVYMPRVSPGACTLSFRMPIPDVNHDAPRSGDVSGTLITGPVRIAVK